MKKLITGLVFMLMTTVVYAKPYQCTGYNGSTPVVGPFTVNASKVPIAEDKAYDRLRKDKVKVDYVKCK